MTRRCTNTLGVLLGLAWVLAPGCSGPRSSEVPSSGAAPLATPVATPVASSETVAADEKAAPNDELVTASFRQLLQDMGVRFDPLEHALEVSGWVNMQRGLVEVFACAPDGKTHESVVVLDCVPSGLHAGLLALGLRAGTPVEMGTGDSYRPPTGDPVIIDVRWTDTDGGERTARAENWVFDQQSDDSMPRKPWVFAGSFMQPVSGDSTQQTYAANYVKSLVTTYHDASSILENPHALGIDDTVYYANERVVPPVGTPITVVFRPAER